MTRKSKIRLALGVPAFILVLAALPRPASSGTCFRCHPTGDGTSTCQTSAHGMTACDDSSGQCVLSGSPC